MGVVSTAFNTDFSDDFDVYDPQPDTEPEPTITPIDWRLQIRVAGDVVDISHTTRFEFTVESGRDDPDEQPPPGRATFTIDTTGTDRAWWLSPGVVIWLDAELGAWPTRTWRRVWTGTITDVRRRFTRSGDSQRHAISVDAVGALATLDRLKVPAGLSGAYPEQLDGVRIWQMLAQVGVSMSITRPESGHIVNDELPNPQGWLWNASSLTVDGGEWAVFTRNHPIPPITAATPKGRRCEVFVTLTVTHAAIVAVNFAGQTAKQLHLQPGTWTVTGAIEPPTNVDAPILQIVVIPQDDVWANTRWRDLDDTPWSGQPVDRMWAAVPTSDQSTTATLHTVDVWRSGWDWGSVWLIARDPDANTDQTVRDHVEEIGRAARGTLWEQHNDGLQWASQLSRDVWTNPSVDLPAGYVVADTETTQSLSGLVNEATVSYWWEGRTGDGDVIPRPSVTVRDARSIAVHGGPYTVSIDGPIRDRSSAVAVARQILRASSTPRERISQLQTIPLQHMDDATVIALLTVTPGAVIEVEGSPAGWTPTGRSWKGFLEGWSLTGGAGRAVDMTLNVSEWYEGLSVQVEAENDTQAAQR